jgi:DNA-binding transcriptional LysR family regulator
VRTPQPLVNCGLPLYCCVNDNNAEPSLMAAAPTADLDGLRAFVEVARRLNFQEAAQVLAVSPSALTRRVKRLEQALGAALFERTTRRVALTPLGRDFLPRARAVVEQLDTTLRWFESAASAHFGQLKIACVPTIARSLMPRLVAAFAQRWPDVKIRIVETHVATMRRMLHSGEADLAIGFLPAPDPELLLDELLVDPYELACPRTHVLARRSSVTWADLRPHALIMSGDPRSSGNRQVLDHALGPVQRTARSVVEVEHLSTAMGLVEEGLGITVVPRSALTDELRRRLAIRPLTGPMVTRTIGVLRHRSRTLSAAARHFRQTVRRLGPRELQALGG